MVRPRRAAVPRRVTMEMQARHALAVPPPAAPARSGALPWRAALPPLAAAVAAIGLWALHARTGGAGGLAAGSLCVWVASAGAALSTARRPRSVPAGAAAGAAGAFLAYLWVARWIAAEPDTLHALMRFMLLGPLRLLPADAALALGGCVFGRLAAGRRLLAPPDVLLWLLGALWLGLAAAALAPVVILAGAWTTRAAVAILAAAAGTVWPRWARREPRPRHRRLHLVPSAARVLPAANDPVPGPAQVPAPAADAPTRRERRRASRRAYRPRLPDPADLMAGWSALRVAVGRIAAHGGALPLVVRTVAWRTNTWRLSALYLVAALVGAPAALFLCLGRRAAWLWLQPASLTRPGATLALVLAFATPALAVAYALRVRLLHPRELTLPRPAWWATGVAAVGAALALRLGWAAAYGRGTLAGALLAPHASWAALILVCLLLPAAQASFYFGLLPTRLDEVAPVWVALLVPAAAFALSGAVTGAPLPGLGLALVLGLWLGWLRHRCGTLGLAAALAAANVALLAFRLG